MTGNDSYFFIKIVACGNFVKCATYSLYCYSFHSHMCKKNILLFCIRAGYVSFFNVLLRLRFLIYKFLLLLTKVKIKICKVSFKHKIFCFVWCHQESNRGHKDFQSFALPTELWHHLFFFVLASAKVVLFFILPNIFSKKSCFKLPVEVGCFSFLLTIK